MTCNYASRSSWQRNRVDGARAKGAAAGDVATGSAGSIRGGNALGRDAKRESFARGGADAVGGREGATVVLINRRVERGSTW